MFAPVLWEVPGQMTRCPCRFGAYVDNFVKMKADAKSFVWNFFENLVNKADGFQQRLL